MAHEIELIKNLGLIAVNFEGEISCAERSRALDQVLLFVENEICLKILIDFRRAQFTKESFERYNAFAKRLATEVRMKPCRLAYLLNESDGSSNPVQALARARGLRSRSFDELCFALDWLLSPAAFSKPSPKIRGDAFNRERRSA